MDFNYRSNIDDDRLTFRVIRGGLAFACIILYFGISNILEISVNSWTRCRIKRVHVTILQDTTRLYKLDNSINRNYARFTYTRLYVQMHS